jgi:hypothetical protein
MSVTTERARRLRKAAPRRQRPKQRASHQKVVTKGTSKSVTAERERELRKAAAPGAVVYRGLCSTCNGASTCTFPRDPERPIMHCDELDSYQGDTVTVKKVAPVEPAGPKAVSEAAQKELRKYKGLCVNCENRETCTFPKPEGGVWHCDEYC